MVHLVNTELQSVIKQWYDRERFTFELRLPGDRIHESCLHNPLRPAKLTFNYQVMQQQGIMPKTLSQISRITLFKIGILNKF
jgi:hypothetical protein